MHPIQKFTALFTFCTILSINSMNLYARGTVKSLSNKALNKIEAEYGAATKGLFSGKDSDQHVLALKRLIVEEIDPDLAIVAISKYQEAKKFRAGSIQKRNALDFIKQLFVGTRLSPKKGLSIILGSGSAVVARESKRTLNTTQNSNKPSCRNKKTVFKRAKRVKYDDLDELAEDVILKELDGEMEYDLMVAN